MALLGQQPEESEIVMPGGDRGSSTTAAVGGKQSAVRRHMLGDQVKDDLLARVLAGEFAPGERIVETRVARELGISQGPVREALRELATLGLVDLEPYRGARVRRPATEEIHEAMRVRGELEALAATEASPRMTAAHLAELRGLVSAMDELAAAGELEAYVRRNTEFHRTVVRASGNRTLERLWELLEPFARTYMTAAASGLNPGRAHRSHQHIVKALASGDPAAAANAMREHSREAQALVGRRDAGRGRGRIETGSKRAGATGAGGRVT
ncbi:MAG: GntR family transcriptional regulator [Actinomycetota bacterium]